MSILMLIALALTVSSSYGDEICCPEVGCFSTDPPFAHLPLPRCNEDIQVNMRLYTRENEEDGQVITRSTIPPAYVSGLRTVFVVHGWLGNGDHWYLHDIKDELLEKAEHNVIVVGWSGGSTDVWYPNSASNTRVVGAEIGLVSQNLVNQGGARGEDMWCVGHSLGGHVCGFAGKFAHFGRLTGLDPAGPWFEGEDPQARITADDADFVDIIHTNTQPGVILALGILQTCGHVDYYPNGGGHQPGCIIDPLEADDSVDPKVDLAPACSHLRVLWLFRRSINLECKFHAREICMDERNLPGSCFTCQEEGGICGTLGYDAELYSYRGILHMTTTGEPPYCLG